MEIEGRTKTLKIAVSVMIATLFSKVLGFVKELLLGQHFGTTGQTDAYLIATTIPLIFFAGVVGAIATVFIPLYNDIRIRRGNNESNRFTNQLINFTFLISLILSIVGCILARPIVSVLGYGFDSETLSLTITLTRIMFPGIIFICLASIFSGYLQSNNSFIIPALIMVPQNLIIIVALYFSSTIGIRGVVVMTLVGTLTQALIHLPRLRRIPLVYSPHIDWYDKNIKIFGMMIIPVFLGIGVQQINGIVDRMLASGLAEGSIAALHFANKLNVFVYGIFSLSISTVVFPQFSRLSIQENKETYSNTLITVLNSITLIMLPIAIAAIILSRPIVSLLYERGAFGEYAVQMTAGALLYYSIGMLFYGYRDVLNKVFYSFKDTRTPMINSSISVILNIVLNIILIRYMQHHGLALATSISVIFTTILMSVSLRKKMGHLYLCRLMGTFVKAVIAASMMGLSIHIIYHYLQTSHLASSLSGILFITVVAGSIIYVVTITVLKVKEVDILFHTIKNFLINKRNS